jgi:hypothetical protein
MWDCKTSKMSQSPHAALNASGLFAAEQRRGGDPRTYEIGGHANAASPNCKVPGLTSEFSDARKGVRTHHGLLFTMFARGSVIGRSCRFAAASVCRGE